jgi:hypothetical protein
MALGISGTHLTTNFIPTPSLELYIFPIFSYRETSIITGWNDDERIKKKRYFYFNRLSNIP